MNPTTAAATGAAASATPHTPSMIPMLVVLVVIVLFYIWMWRQQGAKTKKHQNLVNSLVKGEEIVTTGGVAGRVNQVDDTYISLEVANDLCILVQKSAIATILPKGTLKLNNK